MVKEKPNNQDFSSTSLSVFNMSSILEHCEKFSTQRGTDWVEEKLEDLIPKWIVWIMKKNKTIGRFIANFVLGYKILWQEDPLHEIRGIRIVGRFGRNLANKLFYLGKV